MCIILPVQRPRKSVELIQFAFLALDEKVSQYIALFFHFEEPCCLP